jgi:NodT family efflux transporter outer membrane factor (OMF) lipoprotein
MDGCNGGVSDGLRFAAGSHGGMRRRGERWTKIARRHRTRVTTLLFALVLISSGCTTSLKQWAQNGFKVGPNYAPPAAPVAERWIDQADPRVKNEPTQDRAWWTVFQDPPLNSLIETACQQNLDLHTAGARILEARARRNIAAGNLFPQSQTATAAYLHAQLGKNTGIPFPTTFDLGAAGFNASWELDFWGRYRRTVESADANLGAANEGYGETLVMVLAEVATNYVQLRTFEQRLAFARENVAIQEKSLELTKVRFEQGVGTELDVRQAGTNLEQTRSLIPPLEAGRRLASNRLCTLLGMPPSDLAARLEPGGIPQAPVGVAVGIPADLLCRRPDVRRAEREVAAQSAQIGIAESDLYPRLAVTGFIGYLANDLSDLFQGNNFTGFILPNLQWNILNYGRIVNNVAAQDAKLQQATLQYQQTVLSAGREVEDALVQFLQAQQQARHLEEAVSDSQRTVELTIKQFEGGITDFNRVYTTQSQLVTQQDQFAATRGNIVLYLIQVYRAIGGGWEAFLNGEGMPGSSAGTASVNDSPPSHESNE